MPRERPPEDDVGAYTDRLEIEPPDPVADRSRRRSRLIRRTLLITALVVGVGGGAVFVQLRAKTTPVDVERSVERFREEAGAGDGVEGLPDAGVYLLATDGGDEVTVLGGSRHVYPPETTLTVTPAACGMRFRWDALAERWEEWILCRDDDGRLRLHSIVTYHQFFGTSDRREYFCGDDSTYLPAIRAPGAAWTALCRGDDGTMATFAGEVVGIEFLSVGGTRTRSVHVRVVTTFTGAAEGTREVELWAVAATGLPIVTVSRDDLDTPSPLGQTRYAERYRAELVSLEPRV